MSLCQTFLLQPAFYMPYTLSTQSAGDLPKSSYKSTGTSLLVSIFRGLKICVPLQLLSFPEKANHCTSKIEARFISSWVYVML